MKYHAISVGFASALLFLNACAGLQIQDSTQHQIISLAKGDLALGRLAFLTPSTPTGQEEDKQALALGFAEALREQRPEICYVTLPETLSIINRAGLAEAYREMYDEYRDTGILKHDVLQRISNSVGVRYLLQLKLANFRQDTSGRFSILGWRLVDTKIANIRLFVQVWDAQTGTIAFEAIQELNYADDTMEERPITFQQIMEQTAIRVIEKLP